MPWECQLREGGNDLVRQQEDVPLPQPSLSEGLQSIGGCSHRC